MRNTQPELMFSGLQPGADIDRSGGHVSNVPHQEVGTDNASPRALSRSLNVSLGRGFTDGTLVRLAGLSFRSGAASSVMLVLNSSKSDVSSV